MLLIISLPLQYRYLYTAHIRNLPAMRVDNMAGYSINGSVLDRYIIIIITPSEAFLRRCYVNKPPGFCEL